MSETDTYTGIRAFLPYGLTVLGAAVGLFYVRYGTEHANPVLDLMIGAGLGRFAAFGLTRWLAGK